MPQSPKGPIKGGFGPGKGSLIAQKGDEIFIDIEWKDVIRCIGIGPGNIGPHVFFADPRTGTPPDMDALGCIFVENGRGETILSLVINEDNIVGMQDS